MLAGTIERRCVLLFLQKLPPRVWPASKDRLKTSAGRRFYRGHEVIWPMCLSVARRVYLLGFVLFVSLDPVFAAQPQRSPSALAFSEYMSCLIQGVEHLDDAISDASTIAKGVLPLCEVRRKAMISVFTAGKSATKAAEIASDWSADQEFSATIALVLKNRAFRRKASD